MRRGTSDGESCPVCGTEYDQRVVVQRGDGWHDVAPGPPFTFFTEFPRRCATPTDENAETSLSADELAVYVHRNGGSASP